MMHACQRGSGAGHGSSGVDAHNGEWHDKHAPMVDHGNDGSVGVGTHDVAAGVVKVHVAVICEVGGQ